MNHHIDKKEYHSLLLGVLLHDIGKLFIQPDIEQKHPGKGADVIADYSSDIIEAGFDYDLVKCIIRNHHFSQLKNIDNEYHKGLVQIVNHADGCSAGARCQKSKKHIADTDKRYRPLASLFAHINLGLYPSNDQAENQYNAGIYCHYPKILDWKAIFPEKHVPLTDELKEDIKNSYKNIQTKFKEELKELFNEVQSTDKVAEKQQEVILVSLYSLLYKYLWTVPDDFGRIRLDVSLFDHIRIASALTAALYIYYHNNVNSFTELAPKGVKREEETILLIKGDLSGIQDYIFHIANIGVGGVAKRLRSRSFFLTNLVKVVSHKILHEAVPGAQLPIFCKIIATGGNFIIVAPNLEEVRKKLVSIERSVNKWLFNEFQGDLSFSIAWVPTKTADLEIPKKGESDTTRINRKLTELNELLEEKKQQKLSSWLQCREDNPVTWNETAFIWKNEKDFSNGLCRSCGKNLATADPENVQNPEKAFCKRCKQDREFSEKFVKPPKYISFRKKNSNQSEPTDNDSLIYHFFNENEYEVVLVKDDTQLPADSYLVMCMDPGALKFRHPSFLQPQANYVSRFENETALDQFCDNHCEKYCEKTKTECDYYNCVMGSRKDCPDGIKANFPAVKPFDCLARSVGEKSEKLIGILKADVDWLGMLFSQGMGREASLSRIATLSRMIDLFFSGWLTEFLRGQGEFQDTYTVYAGGDDLLIVSSWEKADKLASVIAEKFREYVAENPQITISAAVAVTKPKFPIAKSAKIADRHLDTAKGIELHQNSATRLSLLSGKNGYHLFGITTRWFKRNSEDIPEEKLERWTNKLEEGINQKLLSKSVIYKLLRLSEMARRWIYGRKKHIEDLRYIALASYLIARDIEGDNASEAKNNLTKRKKELAKELKEMLAREEDKRIFAHFRQPITKALLRTRRNERRKTNGEKRS